MSHDPHCPRGHRLLFQVTDTNDAFEARDEVVRIFGERKGKVAVLVPGTNQPKHVKEYGRAGFGQWHHVEEGFRAYVPIGKPRLVTNLVNAKANGAVRKTT